MLQLIYARDEWPAGPHQYAFTFSPPLLQAANGKQCAASRGPECVRQLPRRDPEYSISEAPIPSLRVQFEPVNSCCDFGRRLLGQHPFCRIGLQGQNNTTPPGGRLKTHASWKLSNPLFLTRRMTDWALTPGGASASWTATGASHYHLGWFRVTYGGFRWLIAANPNRPASQEMGIGYRKNCHGIQLRTR